VTEAPPTQLKVLSMGGAQQRQTTIFSNGTSPMAWFDKTQIFSCHLITVVFSQFQNDSIHAQWMHDYRQ
jgi:hypothetical protein